jgi:hypothetical protein
MLFSGSHPKFVMVNFFLMLGPKILGMVREIIDFCNNIMNELIIPRIVSKWSLPELAVRALLSKAMKSFPGPVVGASSSIVSSLRKPVRQSHFEIFALMPVRIYM